MPVLPYTWQNLDFVTASRLQAELRETGGIPFAANGVGWHAGRPVYRSFTSTAPPASASWAAMSGVTSASWSSVSDTAPLLGSRCDPTGIGVVSATGIVNSAGVRPVTGVNQAGGYFLELVHVPWPSGTGTAGCAIGQSTPVTYGTFQPANTTAQLTWGIDVFDWANTHTGFYEGTASLGPGTAGAGADGSGAALRQSGFWHSVYTTNGLSGRQASLPTVTPSWSSVSSAALNNNIANVMGLLNMPPTLRITSPVATSCTSGTYTPVAYTGATVGGVNLSTYAMFAPSTGTFTAPIAGLYLVAVMAGFDSTANASVVATGITVNGSVNYMGPPMLSHASQSVRPSKVQVLSLNAGDTVSQFVIQYTGSTISTSTAAPPLFIAVWLGYNSTPGSLPSTPDPTWQFTAGLSGAATQAAFANHVANDLLFLTQRPYTLNYQTSAQTGITGNGTWALALGSNTGIVHGDSATSYGGAGFSAYTAPRAGFYLCVEEIFMAVPSLTATPSYAAGYQVSPGGTLAVDYYGQQSAISGLGYGGGATAVAIYYLNAGDTITPTVLTSNVSSTTTSTFVNTGSNPVQTTHFEAVWISG